MVHYLGACCWDSKISAVSQGIVSGCLDLGRDKVFKIRRCDVVNDFVHEDQFGVFSSVF